MREVDELEDDNPVSLSIERRRGRFGRLTVHWSAYGSLDDIFSHFRSGESCCFLFLIVLVILFDRTACFK